MKSAKAKKNIWASLAKGARGAISLMLAVLITPFLTTAAILVEIGRYNSAISILDEALGVSSLSTLSHYDSYLQDRWGLLAMAQDVDIDTLYAQYLNANSKAMGNSLTINQVSASGIYALSDPTVLEAQLLEYCKLNAPTKMGTEIASKLWGMTDLKKTIDNLLKQINPFVNLLTKGVSTVDAGLDLAESVEKLKEASETLESLKTEYNSNYSYFASAMNTLIANLQTRESLNLEEQLSSAQDELAPLETQLTTLQNALAKLEKETPKTEAEKKKKEEEVAEKKAEIGAKKEEIQPIQEQIDSIQTQIDQWNATINNNRSTLSTAKTNYSSTISSIITTLETIREHMSKCVDATTKIAGNVAGFAADVTTIVKNQEEKKGDLKEKEGTLKDLNAELKKWEDEGNTNNPGYMAGVNYKADLERDINQLQTEVGEMELAINLEKTTANSVKTMGDDWRAVVKDYSDASVGEDIQAFGKLLATVNAVAPYQITAETAKATAQVYKNVSIKNPINAADIQAYLDKQAGELAKGSLKALLDGIISIYNQLMGMSVFFESKLSSTIDLAYYDENFGGLPGGESADNPVLNIMKNIGEIFGSAAKIAAPSFSLFKFVTVLRELKNILDNLISLFENIGKLIKNIVTNVLELVDYEKWYLTTYCTYNLACRTDFSDASNSTSFTTMTGYKVGEDSFAQAAKYPNIPVFGEIAVLVQTIVDYMDGTGEDLMFTGAELEYIMFGSTSEVANQLYSFLVMYFIRVISNIPSIMANAEVQSLAAAATLGYPVVMAMYMLLEPFVQTVLLVNGKKQPLIPTKVYLSPSGLPELVTQLIWFCKLTDQEGAALSKNMVEAIAGSQNDYDYQKKLYEYQASNSKIAGLSLDFSYRDYCWLVMLLTVTKEQQVARVSNLIQMETLNYYKNKGASYTFDLRKSYTYLAVEANVSVKQMLPSLANAFLFDVDRKHYRGY